MNRRDRAEACHIPADSFCAMLDGLSRAELEVLAARFYGRCPERFEQLVLELWADRTAPRIERGAA